MAAPGLPLAPRSRAWRAPPEHRARAARGCPWRGEVWAGAERGPAASVYAPRHGGTNSAAAARLPWAAGRGEAGGDRQRSAVLTRSPRAVVRPWCWARGIVSLETRRASAAFLPSSLLALLRRPWQSSGSLFSVFHLENNSEIPEKG